MTQTGGASNTSTLATRIANFQADVAKYIEGKGNASIMTAYLISDQVIIDLFDRFTAVRPGIAAVDTLHLFPETLQLADEVQARYPSFKFVTKKPLDCETNADFVKKHGYPIEISHADFDHHSKIEPIKRAMAELNTDISITGRRCDQGHARVELDVYETDKKTFNPLANWTWADVCEYVILHSIPYNSLHRRVFVSDTAVEPTHRDGYTKFRPIDLALPYFAYDEKWIRALGPHVYVWKSFGDVHTSVVVSLEESERAGRFVNRNQTECGIHSRIVGKGMPHGGKLIERLVSDEAAAHVADAKHTIELNERQVCDLELIVNGGFSPLTGFMTEVEYNSVVHDYRLPEGQLFGLPVTLDTDNEDIQVGDYVILEDKLYGGRGVIHVTSKWAPDRHIEAKHCYGFDELEHPSAHHILTEKAKYNIGGPVFGLKLPQRPWVTCKTPREVRAIIGNKPTIAFQSRNPLHRAHAAMFLQLHRENNGSNVLVHPVVGPTKDDDIPSIVRKRTYDALEKKLENVHFEYLPYSMYVCGPREALQHIIIRKNYGCTGMVVGRDHAGCKNTKTGKDYYGPFDAQEFLKPLLEELAMDMAPFTNMVYAKEIDDYVSEDTAKANNYTLLSISGTKFRGMIYNDEEVPQWFAFPEVINELKAWAAEETRLKAQAAASATAVTA